MPKAPLALAAALAAGLASAADLDDLAVAPEERCAPYDAKLYRYPSDLDRLHVRAHGHKVYESGKLRNAFPSPYTPGISFRFLQDMDIEHIVARSEAHDSGLCSQPLRWSEFASDRLNITVAAEHVNRTLKRDKDPTDWLPDVNRCWYAETWIDVKAKYGLSVDEAERDALARVLRRCERRR